jgi:hypothetical protein
MANLFFSYSHKDEMFRDELETHLSILKRQGIIETWHDRKIDAGSELDGTISQNIESADIVLLLVSPYFLASNYCYDVECQRALERHKEGMAKVIPIIINPCDWKNTPLAGLLATPADGKPITKYANYHDAFLEITTAIRSVAGKISPANEVQKPQDKKQQSFSLPIDHHAAPRSSNLRLKKEFTDHDKDEFLEKTFEYMCNFFEGSLNELQTRNQDVSTKFRQIDANHFTAMIYLNGKVASQCKIWMGGRSLFGGGICYSSNITSNDNSMNDSISVETDGHILYLKTLGHSFISTNRENSNLTQEGASEYFWELLIRNLQY